MHEFYCAFKQIEEGRKKMLIPILLEDLELDDTNIDQDKMAVLQQYLRTYTYMDARKDKNNIEKLRKRIIFKLPAVPLSQMLIVRHTEENRNLIDNDITTPLLETDNDPTATAEHAP